MRVVSRLLAFIILFFLTSALHAQWTNISAGKLPLGATPPGSGSCIVVRGGTIWAGYANQLWSSTNEGATWTNITPAGKPPADLIFDADLFDPNNGVICSRGTVYLTNNGGTTWSIIQNRLGFCASVKFVRSIQEIVCAYNSGPVLFTRNAGASWNTINPTGFTFIDHIVTRRTGEIALLMNNIGGSRVAWTVNDGATWTNSVGTFDYDCWSMAIDSCDANAYYVVNEELYARTDRTAGMYISTNKGQTFNRTASTTNLRYFCGSVTSAAGGVIFAQTITTGILRSNDNGATWVAIGGPNGSLDSRTIASLTKDTIYAIDGFGDVWKTSNSGGFPVTAIGTSTVSISPLTLFEPDTTQLCDSLTRSFQITRSGSCNPPIITSVYLQGVFPGDYEILFSSQDSVVIRFKPGAIGPRNAQAVFVLSNSSYLIRDLRGKGIDSGYKVLINPNPLFASDSILLCKTKTRGIRFSISGCRKPSVTGQFITGVAAGDYSMIQLGDSTTITFDPSQAGLRQALFSLQTSDGRVHSIPLLGVGVDSGPAISITPPILFGGDNLFYCRSVKRAAIITMGPCAVSKVISQTITGTAAGDYILTKGVNNTLMGKDSVVITFQPSIVGARDALYEITFADGSKYVIRLAGRGSDPGNDLYANPNVLFDKDSLLPCRSISRDLDIISNLCVDRKILSQTISGNAAADYTLVRGAADPLTGVDKVTITFSPSVAGPRPALYELVLADSTTLSVPLRGYAIDPGVPITVTPSELFASDSIALCTSVTRGLRIKTNECINKNVSSQIITGISKDDYTITREAPNPLNGDDSVTITYTPSKPGASDAVFEFTLAYGAPIQIPLRGKAYDPGYSYSQTATSLFDGDTVELCKSIERSFSVSASGCIVPKVKIKNITNDVLSEYEIVSNLPDSLTGADIVTIRFTPKALGLRTANFNIELTDGRSVGLPLNGYCINGPYILSVMPQDMFMSDSLFLCQDVEREVEVSLIGCAILRIASQEIRSTDSTAYQVVSKAGDSLSTNTVRVRFIPRKGGVASGEYVITLDDGRSVSIPLGGFGRAPVPLTLSTTATYHTDTLGGTFNLPIIINGLDRPQTIGLTISFDTNLEYLGTTSARTNETLDARRDGNASPLHIILPSSHVIPNEISAYANFAVYADTVKPSFIHIDSLYVLTQDAPCQYITDTRTVTEVTGASGCGITIISDFLRYNKKPDLSIYPNPTSGALTIHSTDKLENVTVEVVDIVGQVRMTTTFTGSLSEFKMNVSALPSGAYRIRLATQDNLFKAEAAVVVEK